MKAPAKAPAKKAVKEQTIEQPKIGTIVIVHLESGDAPMIVTRSGGDGCDGQAFLDGTQTRSVVNATYGDGFGQIASPHTHTKEA